MLSGLVLREIPMKKPNFFLIGAPKCGTTSLAAWLGEHPQIFMSDPKEPWFFNTDVLRKSTETLSEYEAIFESAQPHHVAVGEASTCYLYSHQAVPNVLAYSPGAKFIIILRKPQEMAVSLHAQACRDYEDVRDFETAWRLQIERARGKKLPRLSGAPYTYYQYGERCRVGSQLTRVLDQVPRELLLVIFLEDVRLDPGREYDKVLKFLGVVGFRPMEFRVENSRWYFRSFLLKKTLNALSYAKRKAGLRSATGLLAPFYRLNIRNPGSSHPISGRMQKELDVYFREEILIVQTLLGRVPEEWLS
jgi:hypothetical protein